LTDLLDFQEELPDIPVEAIGAQLYLGNGPGRRLLRMREEEQFKCSFGGAVLKVTAGRLETFLMLAVDYDEQESVT